MAGGYSGTTATTWKVDSEGPKFRTFTLSELSPAFRQNVNRNDSD